MTEDDTERRLRAALQDRAERVDARLTGPELRRRAAGHDAPTGRVRRLVPVLAAAAAVVAIATVTAVIATDDPSPRPVQPGGPPSARTTASVPVVTPAPSSSSPARSTVAPRPATPRPPTASASDGRTPTPDPTTTPTSTPTSRLQSSRPPVSSPSTTPSTVRRTATP